MIRNIVVARQISLADYGIASTFILAMTLVEMVSALGLHQQMVQSKTGDDARFQSALQGFNLLRGCLNGAVLFFLATPIATFFGVPEVSWAFQTIAVVPVVAGFQHFDIHRLSRQMNYLPATLVSTLPPLISLISVYPLSLVFDDYRILLFAILIQHGLIVVISHLVAKRAYRLRLDRAVMRRSLGFGWPLLVNGMLMWAVFNGERVIIGGKLGLEELALFSMAMSLTLSPTLVISKSTMSFFLPQLSGAIGTPPYPNLTISTFQAHFLLGNLLIVGIAVLGGPFIHAVLGLKYAAAIPLLTWLAIMQACRIYKGACSTVAMAAAHTENAMVANIVRVALLPVAWVVVTQGGSLLDVVLIGIAGEAIGFLIGLTLVLWRQSLPLRPLLSSLAVSFILLVIAAYHTQLQAGWVPDARSSLALVFVGLLSILTMPQLRAYVRKRSVSGHSE
jgi:O-antigen/teichoic acid export membrane protein